MRLGCRSCSSDGKIAPQKVPPSQSGTAYLNSRLVSLAIIEDCDDSAFELRAVSELLDIVSEFRTIQACGLPLRTHADCIDWACFFAEAAVDTTKYVDLVGDREFFNGRIV